MIRIDSNAARPMNTLTGFQIEPRTGCVNATSSKSTTIMVKRWIAVMSQPLKHMQPEINTGSIGCRRARGYIAA